MKTKETYEILRAIFNIVSITINTNFESNGFDFVFKAILLNVMKTNVSIILGFICKNLRLHR